LSVRRRAGSHLAAGPGRAGGGGEKGALSLGFRSGDRKRDRRGGMKADITDLRKKGKALGVIP